MSIEGGKIKRKKGVEPLSKPRKNKTKRKVTKKKVKKGGYQLWQLVSLARRNYPALAVGALGALGIDRLINRKKRQTKGDGIKEDFKHFLKNIAKSAIQSSVNVYGDRYLEDRNDRSEFVAEPDIRPGVWEEYYSGDGYVDKYNDEIYKLAVMPKITESFSYLQLE